MLSKQAFQHQAGKSRSDELDLSDCGLEDADMEEVKHLISTCSALASLNLRRVSSATTDTSSIIDTSLHFPMCHRASAGLKPQVGQWLD